MKKITKELATLSKEEIFKVLEQDLPLSKNYLDSLEVNMQVKDIMTKSVCTVKASDHLNDAAHLMWEYDCGCVPVSE